MQERQTQQITIRGDDQKYVVDRNEYPLRQNEEMYIKFITISPTGAPFSFMIVHSDDVLVRESTYTREEEEDNIAKAEKAEAEAETMRKTQEAYQVAVQEEMGRRMAEKRDEGKYIPPAEPVDDVYYG